MLNLAVFAQKKISFDAAAIRNIHREMNGLNISSFFHFSEQLTGGFEMNRFFPANHHVQNEELQLSAWDVDLNFHYILPVYKNLKWYPLTGISHTSEKEVITETKESKYERFWSLNTGAGTLLECRHWLPHLEYSFTWGKINQQFLLAGISYEIETRHYRHKEKAD